MGSIPELGSWTEFRHHLKWNEGHIWISSQPLLITELHTFCYKYVILDSRNKRKKLELINWEQGLDRIADLPKLEVRNKSKFVSQYRHVALRDSIIMEQQSGLH